MIQKKVFVETESELFRTLRYFMLLQKFKMSIKQLVDLSTENVGSSDENKRYDPNSIEKQVRHYFLLLQPLIIVI